MKMKQKTFDFSIKEKDLNTGKFQEQIQLLKILIRIKVTPY